MTGSQIYYILGESRYATIYADHGQYVTLRYLSDNSLSLGDYDRKLLISCNYVHVCKSVTKEQTKTFMQKIIEWIKSNLSSDKNVKKITCKCPTCIKYHITDCHKNLGCQRCNPRKN